MQLLDDCIAKIADFNGGNREIGGLQELRLWRFRRDFVIQALINESLLVSDMHAALSWIGYWFGLSDINAMSHDDSSLEHFFMYVQLFHVQLTSGAVQAASETFEKLQMKAKQSSALKIILILYPNMKFEY